MYENLLKLVVEISEKTEAWPLSEDKDKYEEIEGYLINSEKMPSWEGFVKLVEDLDVIDPTNTAWKALKDARNLI